MDLMTIVGLIAGAATVYYVMADGEILDLLFNSVALVLVFGGTFSSTFIAYPWSIMRHVPGRLKRMFTGGRSSEMERARLVEYMAGLAEKARAQGIGALQPEARAARSSFTAYGLQMLVDGVERSVMAENLASQIESAREHEMKISSVFRTMATLSPIFGLLGTLIGVVQVLRNLSDPGQLGSAMAIAITTTFYGILAANFLFLPTAIKLTEQAEDSALAQRIVAEGILGIEQGDLPMIVRKRLGSLVAGYREGGKS